MPYSDPDKARQYQKEYRRSRRVGLSTTPGTSRLPADFRLKTATDVLELLDEQVNAVRNENDAGTLEKARCVAYLSGVALKAIEQGDVCARLEAVEAVLKRRNKSRNGSR